MKQCTAIAIADKRKMNVKKGILWSEQTYRKSFANIVNNFEFSKFIFAYKKGLSFNDNPFLTFEY
jgi:hypothetical protein